MTVCVWVSRALCICIRNAKDAFGVVAEEEEEEWGGQESKETVGLLWMPLLSPVMANQFVTRTFLNLICNRHDACP